MSRELGVLLFRIIVPAIIFGLQLLVYRKTVNWLSTKDADKGWPIVVTRSLFIVFNLAALYAFIQRPVSVDFPEWIRYGGVYPYFIWHGATFFIGLVSLIISVIKSPFRFIWWLVKKINPQPIARLQTDPVYQKFDKSRRTFLTRGMYGLTAVSFGGAAYGMAFEKSSCQINEKEFSIPDLPDQFDGYSMALLSDIHSGIFMSREEMDDYVTRANLLYADQIIVAGDFVNSDVREVYPFAEAFQNLSAPDGVFGVLGNHDFYTGNPGLVAREAEAGGIRVLRDENHSIQRDGARIELAGIDDVRTMDQARNNLKKTYGKDERSAPRILISHRPYFLPAASEFGVDLMLSGHTHGGQVVLGRFGETIVAPASIASRYVWGSYRHRNTSMYVSRGIGTVGLPVRINCPPEITRVVLRRGTG